MGGALARHLIGKYPLSVLDINAAALATFEKLGAVPAASAAELGRASDIVLLCLPRSHEVRQVIFGPGGLAEGLSPGKIVIDQTSGVPAETREFARRLAEREVALFDAPVSGAMATAVAGTIAIIASGPRDAFTRALPVLNAISTKVYHCGERVGNGQTMKSVNNIMNAACRFATLELVAMGRKMGLTLEAMTEAINSTSARNFTSTGMLPAIIDGRQSTKFGLPLVLKDVNQVLGLGAECGVPMPIASSVRTLVQIGVNTLGPGAQLEDMIRLIEGMAGTRLMPSATQE